MATKSRKSKSPVIVIASNKRGNPVKRHSKGRHESSKRHSGKYNAARIAKQDSTQPVALNDKNNGSPTHNVLGNDKIVGKLFILTGTLIILTVIGLTQINSLAPAKTKVYLPVSTQTQNLTPKSVQILNKTKITPVKNSIYQNGKWELSDESALYLTSSGIPGKKGNIVIYGHNTENIFADLKKAKVGDQIQIEATSGEKLTFKVDTIKSVLPSAVEILKQGSEQRITLYTCTGLLDSMRFVVSGILLNNA